MSKSLLKPGVFKHFICRNCKYPQSSIVRANVPDDLIYWSTSFPDYQPTNYTSPHIVGQIWADLEICDKNFIPKWNALDGNINRVSFHGNYQINADGFPINPFGRTGIKGRGLLGKWGPNHAADPIVTRWKRNEIGEIQQSINNKKILQMVAIERFDNKMWAIPGGMVDAGEKITTTLKREFMEEALNNSDSKAIIEEFFNKNGSEIYQGYVDDSRNTDNAWMETVAYNFHDDTGNKVGKFNLLAGDDASNVKWLDINQNIQLNANHNYFIELVVNKLNADW